MVLGGTGKTGRRVAEKLTARGVPVRVGSRSAEPPFDWNDRDTWGPALRGVTSVYVAYYPDLAIPGAPDDIRALTELAAAAGVRKLVLLSGRGEDVAEECERIVMDSGLDWTIVRSTWFAQNFDESYFRELVLAGRVELPVRDIPEPFVDADDVADVAVAALTDDRHIGQLYELTGPRPLTFAEATAEIAAAAGRKVTFEPIPLDRFAAALAAQGLPQDVIDLLRYLFGTVLDGRNASVTDGVRRALSREPRDFADYARDAAATGVWTPTK